MACRGYKVLMIDLDPQASLTFSFVKPNDWRKTLAPSKTIKNWFTPDKGTIKFNDLIFEPEAVKEHISGDGLLHLIASHLDLINVDLELAAQLGGANLRQAKQNFITTHSRLIEGIEQLGKNSYDLILIDCPPNFNIVTKNAIAAGDYVLIPAKPDYLSTMGVDYLRKSLDRLVTDYNECATAGEDTEGIHPKVLGVVFTMVQFYRGVPISATRPFIAQTKKLQIPVFESYIRENKTLFADAPLYGVPVVLTNSSRADIVGEIETFVDEFEHKVLL